MIIRQDDEQTLRLYAEEDFTISNSQALQQTMMHGLQSAGPQNQVILDLTGIHYMDSVGMKLLVGLHKTCTEKAASLAIEVASPLILRLIRICKLDKLLEVRDKGSSESCPA